MKYGLLFVLGFSMLVGCSEAPKKEVVEETIKITKQISNVVPNEVMTVEIKGMSCEHACGGSIRKGLLETGSVARVQFENFDMESEYNTAKIYFDKDKISVEKITELISSLNNKQFTIGKLTTEEYSVPTAIFIEEESSNDTQEKSTIQTSTMQLPNLFDLLRSVILN